jgi:hypothetical protein
MTPTLPQIQVTHVVILAKQEATTPSPHVVILAKPEATTPSPHVVILAKPEATTPSPHVVILAKPESPYWSLVCVGPPVYPCRKRCMTTTASAAEVASPLTPNLEPRTSS